MNSWPCQQPLVVAHTPTNPFLGLHSRSPPRVSLVVAHSTVEGKRTSGGRPYRHDLVTHSFLTILLFLTLFRVMCSSHLPTPGPYGSSS